MNQNQIEFFRVNRRPSWRGPRAVTPPLVPAGTGRKVRMGAGALEERLEKNKYGRVVVIDIMSFLAKKK